MSLIVKIGKAGKRIVKKVLAPAEKHSVSYTRRIEQVKTTKRICAMTFDDGPMDLPAVPDRFEGKALTDILLDILAEFGSEEEAMAKACQNGMFTKFNNSFLGVWKKGTK